jgi:hypothetical protein
VIAYVVMSNRTSDVTATVAGMHWQLSIDVLEQQPVQKSAWSDGVPSQAQDVSCRDEYKETSSNPAPKSTEVCGTPYTIDQGSGAGKVVQDCEYRIYASYCDFTVQDWVVVNTAVAQGSDNNPQWPVLTMAAGQQEGDRHETYQVTFDADGQSYAYIPVDMAEFSQFDLASRWVLGINPFGAVKEVRSP